jgi:hypothetical protein
MLVTNGFFLHRFPQLPDALRETRCQLEVSQHGTHERYLSKFREVKQLVWRWREHYPGIQIKIRQSHRGWRQQHRMIDGKPMPFDSDPRAAWNICLQRSCTQLYGSCLWKCPALAYHAMMSRKLKLDEEHAWQPFRDYRPCPPNASDEQIRDFVAKEEIPQCSLCPAQKIRIHHSDPTAMS